MSKKQDLTKLKDLIAQNSSNDTHLVFNNTFAMACYLSIMGETIASEKLLNSLFDWLGRERRTTYFQDIFRIFSVVSTPMLIFTAKKLKQTSNSRIY